MTTPSLSQAARATRLGFFCAGFAVSCWAPLIPFAKAQVGADEAVLGLLLLCLGIGSVTAMAVTGWMAARFGARPMILLGGFGLSLGLPLLLVAQTQIQLGVVLLVFGAALGTLDVAINIHAVEVEKRAERSMMSGFHALFSLGGIVGAASMIALLWLGLSALLAAGVGGVVALVTTLLTRPGLYRSEGAEPEPLALPRGIVVLLALLTAITFLVEGAILDWSALLLLERDLVTIENGGLGYLFFSVAMTLARLTGDRLVTSAGRQVVLVAGGVTASCGLMLILLAPAAWLSLTGFAVVGLGAANLVPILFSAAGHQKIMPPGMAIAAVTTTGYGGMLLGPALIGFVADASSLSFAFWILALMMLALPLTARRVTRA